MKVGIDITGLFHAKYRTGVQNYYYALIEGLMGLDLEDQGAEFVLIDRSVQNLNHLSINLGSRIEYRRATPLQCIPTLDVGGSNPLFSFGAKAWNKVIRELRRGIANWQKRVDRILEDVDVFHVWNWEIKQCRSKHVITLTDIIPLLFPESFRSDFVEATKLGLAFAKEEADAVITISEYSKRDLIGFGQIPPNKIKVIYPAIDPIFQRVKNNATTDEVLRRYGIADAPYVLSVGILHVRKNITGHIKGFEKLVLERDLPEYRLVLIGPESQKTTDLILDEVKSSRVRDRIVITGYVPCLDLPILYSAASAFLYCSLYEGFGFPPLEAMACGTPVVTSNRSSLPEVCGDAALFVDPTDYDRIAEATFRAINDIALRNELISRGLERAKQFTWQRCAHEHLEFYKHCCD